jgi:hypothetical protein
MPPPPQRLVAASAAAAIANAARRPSLGTSLSSGSIHDLPLSLRKRKCNTPKQRFATFVAVLLMHLDGTAGGNTNTKNYKLSIQAKALVAECCRRNQMGDKHFMPLQDSLSERLYGLVGEYHWNRARTFLHIYLARHHGFHYKRDEQEEDRRLLRYPTASNRRLSLLQEQRQQPGYQPCDQPQQRL